MSRTERAEELKKILRLRMMPGQPTAEKVSSPSRRLLRSLLAQTLFIRGADTQNRSIFCHKQAHDWARKRRGLISSPGEEV